MIVVISRAMMVLVLALPLAACLDTPPEQESPWTTRAPLDVGLTRVDPNEPGVATSRPALFRAVIPGAPHGGLPLVLGAWALADGRSVAFVTAGGALKIWSTDGASRTLDRDVIPQVALSPRGPLLAYPKHPTADGALWLVDARSGKRWRLSSGGAACMPTFSPDGSRIVFVDTSPEGLSALFAAVLRRPGSPRQLTNIGLRAHGRRPAGHVPPPDDPGSLRWSRRGITFEAGGERWLVDPESGETSRRRP